MARRRKRNKKWVFRLFFLLLLVVAVVICYFVWDAYFNNRKNEPELVEETSQVVEEPDNKGEEVKSDETVVEKQEIVQFDGEDPNKSEGLTGAITYLGVAGEVLMIRVNIDQYLTGGNCELNIRQGNEIVYNEVVSVVDAASTATCEGFNVPLNKIPTGKMQVSIGVNSGGKLGLINGEVEL